MDSPLRLLPSKLAAFLALSSCRRPVLARLVQVSNAGDLNGEYTTADGASNYVSTGPK